MIKLPQKTAQAAQPETLTVRAALAEMGWKSDAELMREAYEKAFGQDENTRQLVRQMLGLDAWRYGRWIAAEDEQDAATELITILRAPAPDPEQAERWIERHRDKLTPPLLASIVRIAMDRQAQESIEPLLAGKKQQRERWPDLLRRWEELERKGIKGKAREDMICKEFPIGRASIASMLTKAPMATQTPPPEVIGDGV